jgi:hypothetical protein
MRKYILLVFLTLISGGSYAASIMIWLTILPATGTNNTGTNFTGVVFTWGGSSPWAGNNSAYTVIPSLWNAPLSGFVTTWSIITGSAIDELVTSYEWARRNNITSMPTAESARLMQPITRAELAKVMVQFSLSVIWKTIGPNETCDINKYKDNAIMDAEERFYIKLACDANIMWWKNDKTWIIKYFKPHDLVSRAEFATVLSRFLFGSRYDGDMSEARYDKHLKALSDATYIKKIDTPFMRELRGYVFLILNRIAIKRAST